MWAYFGDQQASLMIQTIFSDVRLQSNQPNGEPPAIPAIFVLWLLQNFHEHEVDTPFHQAVVALMLKAVDWSS